MPLTQALAAALLALCERGERPTLAQAHALRARRLATVQQYRRTETGAIAPWLCDPTAEGHALAASLRGGQRAA